MTDDLPAPIADAIVEWAWEHDALSRAEFDQLNSALIRTVGEAAEHEEFGRNQHLRKTDAQAAGEFAYEHDVALAELDEDVSYVDLHGFAVDEGFVPVLICLDGPIQEVAERQHRLYHLVDDTSPCHCRAVTDGGVPLEDRVDRYIASNPTAELPEIAGALDAPPAAVAEVLAERSPESGQASNADTGDRVRGSGTRSPQGHDGRSPTWSRWDDADFENPDSDVYPPALLEREQWMGHREKKPFAPWADRNHPDAEPDQDARWKWGIEDNYVDGETIAMAEVDPRLDGRAFLQQPDDPFAYVDGDDVRDPETGAVHPAFVAILEHLGLTYADISQSGAGVHAIYRGELPEGVKQTSWQLDTKPWGSNDEPPSIEVYPGKRVCVMTGDHVPGTPTEVREWSDDVLDALLEANDAVAISQRDRAYEDVSTDRSAYDLEDYEPDAKTLTETTDDIRDIFAAIDRLDARHVAEKTIVARWNDDASTSDGERAFYPTWGRNSNGTANIVNDERWIDTGDRGGYGGPVTMAAIDAGEISERNAAPVDGETWWRGIEHLRELGFDIPKYTGGDGSESRDSEPDSTKNDVVLEPRRAWDAAGRVTPADLEESLPLETTADGEGWRAEGVRIDDVARAVAYATGLVESADARLSDEYADGYRCARERYGAPLPEYLTAADAVGRFDKVLGAVRELSYWHLDEGALTVDVTNAGDDVSGDAVRTLDPTPADGWRDSESGESVLVFESGTIWDADLDDEGGVIDTLRFVALDAGLVDNPQDTLEGEDFTEAYRIAREEYGAPLPRWNAGDPDVTPVLPPAEDLVDAPVDVGDADIDAVRAEVEDLYGDVSRQRDKPVILRVLPALGKTTSAIKTAARHDDRGHSRRPTTYLAPRKELMAQAARKADTHGASYLHLPILSEYTIPEEALTDAIEHVRENGMSALRDRWGLLSLVGGLNDCDGGSADDVHLDRPTCPTAECEHNEAWALAVHVARALDYTPRDIHERAEALFGTELPCQEDGDCPYSEGWERIAEPDAPVDLLIGHYTHANVESARTYYTRGESGRTNRSPRTLVLDEYPGLTFAEAFGEDVKDHITWLAGALNSEIDDFQDLLERNLWSDEFVRAWLAGEAAEDDGPAVDTVRALGAREEAHAAAEAAAMFCQDYEDLLEEHDLLDPIEEFVETYPDVDADSRGAIAGTIRAAVSRLPADAPGFKILQWLQDDVADPLAKSADVEMTVDIDDVPGGGELVGLVERALEAADAGEDGAVGLLAAAQDALRGGDAGARELAVWGDDGYAHRQAHYLLEAALTPDSDDATARIATEEYTFGADEATLKHVQVGAAGTDVTVLLDRDYNGAEVLTPPSRSAGGDTCPVVGLDATARRDLWELALGESVSIEDVHDSDAERAEALRELHDLQVVQTTDLIKSYEGDPSGKNLDADVALLEEIADRFSGVHAPRTRDDGGDVLGKPAAITTKVVRQVLEDDPDAQAAVSVWENYGNLKGSNDLGDHRLAALLGCQHYGDRAVERMAAFAGEEVTRQDYGHRLDYDSRVANEYLGHMREDQVMQAVLRFARGDSGALVFAHTAALREDLPVVGEGQVIKSWSPTARKIAEAWRRQPGSEFTATDVADAVDVTKRQVRRVLAEFVEAGYLERHDPGDGLANEYITSAQPGVGEVQLHHGEIPEDDPGQNDSKVTYTAHVRVPGVNNADLPRATGAGSTLPAPGEPLGDRSPG